MDQYRHHVSGFFAHRAEAEGAVSTLVGRGLGRDRLQLFDADSGPAISEPKGESNEVLTNVLFDGAIGTAVGTGMGPWRNWRLWRAVSVYWSRAHWSRH